MKFTVSATLFSLAFATLGLAAPIEAVPADGSSLLRSKRTLGSYYFCPAFDWQPADGQKCLRYTMSRVGQCYTFGTAQAAAISSVGPDPGTWCMLYTERECSGGDSDAFSYPGMAKLDGYWATWNDNTKSIRCWW